MPRPDASPRTAARHLCLHYVTPTGATPTDDLGVARRLAMRTDVLAQALRRELEQRAPASLLEALDDQTHERFTVSFDDAHVSVLTHAAPVLAALGIPATLFVPTAWIGTGDEWLDEDGLRALRDLGWTIGAHTVTHPRMSWALYGESAAQHAQRLKDECARSRETLTRILGEAPAIFAYPYGEDPPAAREAVSAAGFSLAFTVREDRAWDGDPRSIPRLDGMEATGVVEAGEGPPLGISVVVPARDRSPILRETLGRLAAQSYPSELHEVIVVDDASTEDLRAVMPDAASFRLLPSTNANGRFSAGQTRSRGVAEARHPIVAFLDADVAVGRDYLWALDWVHRRWDRTVLCGYLSGYNLHDLDHVHTLAQVSGVEPLESIPVIPDRQREPVARAVLDNVDWLSEPWRLCYTGNLSMPRALFDEIGGFDAGFTGWGLEDLDLGIRLHRAGAQWIFSRFALGYHLVDPSEPAPRNPFRKAAPTPEDFAGLLTNLALLAERHAGDATIAAYVERTRADVAETCSRPSTVGIEVGGAATVRPPFHRKLHRVQPGGVPTEELLDRVAYAVKVGAKKLWLLGGEPAEHPGFLSVLQMAHRHGLRTGMESMGHPFADQGLAEQARALGLQHVTVLTFGGDERAHDELAGDGAWRRYLAGCARLDEAGVHRSARLVVTPSTAGSMDAHGAALKAAGTPLDDRVLLDEPPH